MIEDEWGAGLVRSWDHWLDLPVARRRPARRGPARGRTGQTLVADSVTVNLYKLTAAVARRGPGRDGSSWCPTTSSRPTATWSTGPPGRRVGWHGWSPADPVEGIDVDRLAAAVGPDTALVVLSLVSFRSAALADIEAVTELVHRAGALVLWDLSHAVGAVPIDLDAVGADLAVGCTYKYLNAGPGAPAFLYVAGRHHGRLRSPIQGWFAQRDQFAMGRRLRAARRGRRVRGGHAVDPRRRRGRRGRRPARGGRHRPGAGEGHGPHGAGVRPRRRVAGAARVRGRVAPRPRTDEVTTSRVRHPDAGPSAPRSIGDAGVVPDVRPPDRIRLGAAPLSSRFTEVWDALDRTRRLVAQRF